MTDKSIENLVETLTFKEKVDRAFDLISLYFQKYGDGLVIANSLGKDSAVVWDIAKRVSPKIRGFIITTRLKPPETIKFMEEEVARFPELQIFSNNEAMNGNLYAFDPDLCCFKLKVIPVREAIQKMSAQCWVTGLRCTEGRTRVDFQEVEERDEGLIKLNPILTWKEREVWQYLALRRVRVNPLYGEGYRSLGCLPCSHIIRGGEERSGRWQGTSKCGGECGIHVRPLREKVDKKGGER